MKMAGSQGASDAWRISGEDRAKHDTQFYQLKPVNGFVTGNQARDFFMQSGLATQVLGVIWTLADMNGDGKMDKKEFSIAMHLIKKKLQGYELPKVLPASLKADPTPVMGSFAQPSMGTPMGQPMGMGFQMSGISAPMPGGMTMQTMPMMQPQASLGTSTMTTGSLGMPRMANGTTASVTVCNMPGTGTMTGVSSGVAPVGGASIWTIPHSNKLKHTQAFNTHDRNKRGYLLGVEARAILMQTNLPQPVLAQIWTLADVDRDGKLTCDEYCIAMHLSELARLGHAMPQALPPELLPSKARSGSLTSPPSSGSQPATPKKDAFNDLLGNIGMPQPAAPVPTAAQPVEEIAVDDQVTFEDKRKENFDKGQAELERRRAILREQQKKEENERLEKERQEAEKRERQRIEAENRRQAELQRQLERQREKEREIEEQRRKMVEQREAARRELERQRQMEWEKQRKEQLLAEKQREYEQLSVLKTQMASLKAELESLDGKKTELSLKISQVQAGVTDFTTSIDAMRVSRDRTLSDIDVYERQSSELNRKLSSLSGEKDMLNVRIQTAQATPMMDAHRTVMHSVEQKRSGIQQLKKEVEQLESDTEARLGEIDCNNAELKNLQEQLAKLERELPLRQKQQEEKAAQQRKEAQELQQKQRQEKERQERLKQEIQAKQNSIDKTPAVQQPASSSDSNWFDFNSSDAVSSRGGEQESAVSWDSAFSGIPSTTSNFSSTTQKSSAAWDANGATTTGSHKTKYRAIYDFTATREDELNLVAGEEVWVPNESETVPGMEDWHKGERGGLSGWFPKAYVEKVEEQSTDLFGSAFEPVQSSASVLSNEPDLFGAQFTQAKSQADNSSMGSLDSTSSQSQTSSEGLLAKATYPWKARQETDLTFDKDDVILVKEQQEMRWFGELNGKSGWFPKAYVKLIGVAPKTDSGIESSSSTQAPAVSAVSANPAPEGGQEEEYYIAMYSYVSDEPVDLNFNEGDVILVTASTGDWWTGSIAEKGQTGIFPANYVKKLDIQPHQGSISLQNDPLDPQLSGFNNLSVVPPPKPPRLSSNILDLFNSTPGSTELNKDLFGGNTTTSGTEVNHLSTTPFTMTSNQQSIPDLSSHQPEDIFGSLNLGGTNSSSEQFEGLNSLDWSSQGISGEKPKVEVPFTSQVVSQNIASIVASRDKEITGAASPSVGFMGSLGPPLGLNLGKSASNNSLEGFDMRDPNLGTVSLDNSNFNANVLRADNSNVGMRGSVSPSIGLLGPFGPLLEIGGSTGQERPVSCPILGDVGSSGPSLARVGSANLNNEGIASTQSVLGSVESSHELPSAVDGGILSTGNSVGLLSLGVENNASSLPPSNEGNAADPFKGIDPFANESDLFGNGTSHPDTTGQGTGREMQGLKKETADPLGFDMFASNLLSSVGQTSTLKTNSSLPDILIMGDDAQKVKATSGASQDLASVIPVQGVEITDTRHRSGSRPAPLPPGRTLEPATLSPDLPEQKSTKKPEIARVIAPYVATGTGQLSLEIGNLINVRQKSPRGWWEGELQVRGQKKKIGWFPANYVKLLGSLSARSTPEPSTLTVGAAGSRSNTPQSIASQDGVYGINQQETVVALYAYTAQNSDELTFQKDAVITVLGRDNPDWWSGQLDGQTGVFPSNYVTPNPQSQSWMNDTVQEELTKAERKRQQVIQELINTEESYNTDMQTALEVFKKPMQTAGTIPADQINQIFVNWEELIVCNKKFLQALRVRKKMVGKKGVIMIIGDILCESLPHMNPYMRFCSCQLSAAAVLQRAAETSTAFQEFHKAAMQNPKVKGVHLSGYLLKPMQRITRYPLLIEKILAHTPSEHADRSNLEEAMTLAQELCAEANQCVKERQNSDCLEWIQRNVHCDGLAENITFNSMTNCLGPRRVIYSGILYKTKSNKELVGFLFNDFLLLAHTSRPLGPTYSTLKLYETSTAFKMYRSPIFLNEVLVKKSADDADPCQFHITSDRIINLKAVSAIERDTWVKEIETASKHYKDKAKHKLERAHSVLRAKPVGRVLVVVEEGVRLRPPYDATVKRPSVGRILVVIQEASHLKASDANGKSDPYCEVSMGSQEHRTKVIPGTLNPRWNASMQFLIRDVDRDTLCFTVYDRDLYSPNDFLGRTEVRIQDVLEESGEKRGPITKRLILHEVETGEVVVKLDLQLYES